MNTIKSIVPQSIKNIYHALTAHIEAFQAGYPSKKLKIIGVTGTDGKTTTSTMIYHVLKNSGHKVALISTVAAYLGDEVINTGFHTTTPHPRVLQQLLKRIAEREIDYVVLEATSIGLDQHRLLGTHIPYGVFTNISHEHMDYHHTFESYIRAKAKLMKNARVAVLNKDDAYFKDLESYKPSKTKLLTYSLNNLQRFPYIPTVFKAPHNQQNALACATLCQFLGVSLNDIKTALKKFPGVPGRLEMVPNNLKLHIYVDFAHTPNAIKHILNHLKPKKGKLIAVFGATGKRDNSKRSIMGQFAAEYADEIILTSDDTYGEDISSIIGQIKSGIKKNIGHVHAIPDRHQAIKFALLELAKPGDVVAVLGQGHEQTLNLDGTTEIPWSDQKVISAIINQA